MKFTKIIALSISTILLLSLSTTNSLKAQSNKEVLQIEDIKLWRNNSVTLSDDGKWYTVLYSLTEKPDAPTKDSPKEKDNTESENFDFYGEEYRSDVLYIYNVKSGIKYKIPDGSNPLFSSASDWIAYQINQESVNGDKEKDKKLIELKNLLTGKTIQYTSDARYQFIEDKNYFITLDQNSLLIVDLENLNEHYISSIGEYLIDKKTEDIAYTISTEDMRGNGIYIYNLNKSTTRALNTGNYFYSNLAWNKDKTDLAAYRYNKVKENIDFKNMSIITVSRLESEQGKYSEYPIKDILDMPENMGPAIKFTRYANSIKWSNDGERLFIKIKEYNSENNKEQKDEKNTEELSTVDVWHWKDKKLLSQRMLEEERNKNKVFDAVFLLNEQRIIQLTSEELQGLQYSEGTDRWAVGTDNRDYISDWDVRKNDLYRINLYNGDKKLIEQKSSGGINISPAGDKIILWDGENYLLHDFDKDLKVNLTSGMDLSFIDKENDHWGSSRSYGFVAWVKDKNAVIINHKLDLWLISLDGISEAVNLTESITSVDPIRFRLDDMSFTRESEPEDRYLDLSSSTILNALNIENKYAGYYELKENAIKRLIYKPASYSASRRGSGIIKAKNSDAIIFKMGDYQNFPEAYLSDLEFSKPKKISNTNPQQKSYRWGHRILIDYTNDDGVDLQGVLSIPDGYKKGSKLPMLVYSYEKMSQTMYSYSSPGLSGSRICEMMYVSDGYLVLLPDIHFNVRTPHSDMHECLDAAIERVIELGYVDENCIGYEGFSYGGHTGMYVSTQDDNKFAAIAAGAGVSNLVQGFNIDIVGDGSNEQDYYMGGQGRLGSDPASDTEMFISESAVFNASNMNTPLLLFHGTSDSVVQWEHSFGFYSILRYLKKPVVFLSYKGEGHGLRQKGNRLDIQIRLKEYFDHYLKGQPAGDWILEGIPYKAKEERKDKEKTPRAVPVWK